MQPGFMLNGLVIIPAKVAVGKILKNIEGGENHDKSHSMDPN
jgi:hypothetical protein